MLGPLASCLHLHALERENYRQYIKTPRKHIESVQHDFVGVHFGVGSGNLGVLPNSGTV